MNSVEKKVEKAEVEIKEAVDAIESAKDAVFDSCEKDIGLLGAAKDLEKAEDAALVACEATEEAEFKLKE